MVRLFVSGALSALSAIFVCASVAQAATVSWGSATNTTGASSVLTTGSIVKAFDSGGSGATVNGVTFLAARGAGDDIGAVLLGSFDVFDDNADLGDAGLDLLLRTGDYLANVGSLPSAITTLIELTGLQVGKTYQLQLFFMDQRNSPSSPPNSCVTCADRQMTFESGANSVTLDADSGNGLGAPFGQYVIGTFIADSTTQGFGIRGGIDFDPFWNAPVSLRQVNAWQLRVLDDAAPVPLPASAPLFLLGSALVAVCRRRLSKQA